MLQPPELLLNWNPQLAAPFNPQFFPNQASQLTPVLPPNGQEQQPQEPNAANGPRPPLNPVQVQKTVQAYVIHLFNVIHLLCVRLQVE